MQRTHKFLMILSAFILFSVTCGLVGGAVPTPDASAQSTQMQATVDMLQQTISAMEANGQATADAWMTQVAATGQPDEQPAQQAPTEELLPGAIRGQLSYPAESIPPLRLVLWNAEDGTYLSQEFAQNTGEYVWEDIPAGHYKLVAYRMDDAYATLAGGYSRAVACGLLADCTDHSLVVFEVRPGLETSGINPGDWYAPAGSFPTDPTR